MKGAAWSDGERDWKRAPHMYAAIHFHDDDLHDCGWADDFSFTVPKDMKSGVYGMQLRCGPHRDVIPFFVRPQIGKPQAKVCYIASTFTYQVYTNFSRGMFNDAVPPARQPSGRPRPTIPTSTRITGLLDLQLPSRRLGRGLLLAPAALADLAARLSSPSRPGGLGPAPSAGRHHLTGWFDRLASPTTSSPTTTCMRRAWTSLASYKVVVTGTHPEYHTKETLDAAAGLLPKPAGG
jgi:N,N-dimethylformamidase